MFTPWSAESDMKPSHLLLTLFCVGMRQGAFVLVMDLSRQLISLADQLGQL
jgi:hypothetical protein